MERFLDLVTQRIGLLLASLVFVLMSASGGHAAPNSGGGFLRDVTYEQDLRVSASPDQTITPARILRWLGCLMEHTTFSPSPSNTEFEPIVNVDNSHVRVVAALAYKF